MTAPIDIKYPGDNPLFMIGTSGLGIKSLRELASNIPGNFPCPIVFLLHSIRDGVRSKPIDTFIKSHSRLKVEVATEGLAIRAGTIYVSDVNKHLTIAGDRFALKDDPADSRWRPNIDQLFISGAQSYGENAIGILLSGNLDDGVEGLREITRKGGVTIAQSPEDAYDPVLPLNAILKDHPSYVLPLHDMPALFCELAGFQAFDNQAEILEKAALTAARKK